MLDDKQLSRLTEILRDAESCARLTQWEEEFLADMRGRVLIHGSGTRVSDPQWAVLTRIEGKVYAT